MSWIEEVVSPSVRNHVAYTGELEFIGAAEDDRTGRTVQFRLVRAPEQLKEAHPFSTYTRRRRGHAGTRFHAVFNAITGDQTVDCEVMLLNWADGPKGATVKFLLDFALDDHPFLKCTRRAKDNAGTGFMCVLMEIGDDDEIIDQAKRERVERHHQKLSNVAAMIVKHPRFHEWLRETEQGDVSWSSAMADNWLKGTLGIESKAELDDDANADAIARFLKLKAAFVDWQEEQGYDVED